MAKYNFSGKYEHLYVCGDIHGEFMTLQHLLRQKGVSNAVVIVAGDCGIGFESPENYDRLYNERLHDWLQASHMMLLLMRGNHDDPRYFNERLIDFEYMKSIPDYSVVQVAGHNVLCSGGAVSVDRFPRQSQMTQERLLGKDRHPVYWDDEAFVYNDRQLNGIHQSGIKIDTLVTHGVPSACNPTDMRKIMHFLAIDETLTSDLRKESAEFKRLYDNLTRNHHPIRHWYSGHYHMSSTLQMGHTTVHILDIFELAGPL